MPRLVPSALFMPVSSVAYSINPSSSEQLLIERLKASSLPISAVGRYLSGTIFARMESLLSRCMTISAARRVQRFSLRGKGTSVMA